MPRFNGLSYSFMTLNVIAVLENKLSQLWYAFTKKMLDLYLVPAPVQLGEKEQKKPIEIESRGEICKLGSRQSGVICHGSDSSLSCDDYLRCHVCIKLRST